MTGQQLWSTETAIGPRRANRACMVLIAVIEVTCLSPLLFVPPG